VHNGQVTATTGYPFEPKSIARLQPGQFWAVPLTDGRHACGRVLHVPDTADSLYLNSRIFLAGHMTGPARSRPQARPSRDEGSWPRDACTSQRQPHKRPGPCQ
jgi:hypothetical protein